MRQCLEKICQEFEQTRGFLKNRAEETEELIYNLFYDFIKCYGELKEEKLEYPKEFAEDVRLYKEGNPNVIGKFEDIEMMYLMLSDFYDFVRMTKKYVSKG